MLRQILLCLAVSLLAACANHAPEATGAFGRADSNNDRKVSLNEWQLVGGKDAAFLAADPERRGSTRSTGAVCSIVSTSSTCWMVTVPLSAGRARP